MIVRVLGGSLLTGLLIASCSGGPARIDASTDNGGTDLAADNGSLTDSDISPSDMAPWEPDPPPPWVAPPGVESEPGWRDSTVPTCAPFIGKPDRATVWGDSRGVFLLAGVTNNPFADYGFPSGWSLQMNSGTGWVELVRVPTESVTPGTPDRLAGFDAAPVWLLEPSCALRSVAADDTSCILSSPIWGNPIISYFRYASDAMVFTEAPVPQSGNPVRLRRFVQGSPVETILEDVATFAIQGVSKMWSDGDSVVFAHEGGIVERQASGMILPAVPIPSPLVRPREVRGPEDVWYSDDETDGAVFGHYDGDGWVTFTLPTPACTENFSGSVIGTFATPSGLWILRDRSLYRWATDELITVLDWGCEYPQEMESIHGSPNVDEVYLVLQDPGFEVYACGSTFILWSDGTTTRRF